MWSAHRGGPSCGVWSARMIIDERVESPMRDAYVRFERGRLVDVNCSSCHLLPVDSVRVSVSANEDDMKGGEGEMKADGRWR